MTNVDETDRRLSREEFLKRNDKNGDGEVAFRALYKELVETNTSHSGGYCTLAAERMAARESFSTTLPAT